MHNKILRTLPVVGLLLSGLASAAGAQSWQQSAAGLGVSYAGSAAVADDASTAFYNAAGLTQLDGLQFSVGGVGVRNRVQFRSAVGGVNGGDAGDAALRPNLHLAWRVAPNWSVGFSASETFGWSTDYDAAWVGNGQALRSELTTLNLSPSVAYRVNDALSLGFGLDYQRADLRLTRVGQDLRVDDGAWGWHAGALWTLSPSMRLGLNYRSSFTHRLDGRDGATPAQAKLTLPDTLSFSVWQQVSDRWEAMGDLSYTRWRLLRDVTVRNDLTGAVLNTEAFRYDNAWRFAWGAAYKADAHWKLKFGTAYEKTPQRTPLRSARVPDNDRWWLSLGAQWDSLSWGRFDIGYAYQVMRDARLDDGATRGKYDLGGHLLGVQYSVAF